LCGCVWDRIYIKSILVVKEIEAEVLKQDIRKALIYAITSSINPFPFGYEDVKISMARNIVSEFYHSLNRKRFLTNKETEEELKEAYALLSEKL